MSLNRSPTDPLAESEPTTVTPTLFLAVYEEWRDGRLTQPQAATRLGIAERTFRRYVAGFRAEGHEWLERRYANRPPDRSVPAKEIAALQDLYLKRYLGWSVAHFYERYRDEHCGQRSYVWVKSQLQAAGLVTKEGPRNASRRRLPEPAPEQCETRTPREGVVIHYLASRHEWVAKQWWDLIVTVDDATNRVHSGFFVDSRGIWSVFRSVREVIQRRGVFGTLTLRGSRDTCGGPTGREQLSRAMKELGVTLSLGECSRHFGSARVLRTLRGRLPQELAAGRINAIAEANAFLSGFWSSFNLLSAVEPTGSPHAFVSVLPSDQAILKDTLCLKRRAMIGFGNYVNSKRQQLPIPPEVRRRLCECQPVLLHEYEDGSLAVFRGPEQLTTLPSPST